MYIVTKPDVIQTIQKHHTTLAFPPVEASFSVKVCGVSAETEAIVKHNVNGEEGDFGLSMSSHEVMRSNLKPGSQIDDMNRSMIREVANSLDSLQPAKGESVTVGMYSWIQESLTKATTMSVYGPLNPYQDPAIADAFWSVLHLPLT
jgi:hypothetical protein